MMTGSKYRNVRGKTSIQTGKLVCTVRRKEERERRQIKVRENEGSKRQKSNKKRNE